MMIRYGNFDIEFKRYDFFLFSLYFNIEFRQSVKKQIRKFATFNF